MPRERRVSLSMCRSPAFWKKKRRVRGTTPKKKNLASLEKQGGHSKKTRAPFYNKKEKGVTLKKKRACFRG